MSLVISDDFDDADGTDPTSRASAVGGTCAENASATAGGATIHNGAAYASGGSNSQLTALVWPGDYADIEAEIEVDVKDQRTDHWVGLGMRGSASSLLWTAFWAFADFAGSDYEYAAFSTGDSIYLQNAVYGTVATGDHRLKASFRGTMFQGWQDREEVVRVTCDDYSAGKVALLWGNQSTTTTGCHVKSLRAYTAFLRSQVQFPGDSHWAGDGPVSNVGRANRVPNRVMAALLADGLDLDWANLGVSARQLSEMETAADQAPANNVNTIVQTYNTQGTNYGRGANLAYRPAAAKNLIVLIGGTNDMRGGAGGGNVSSATAISRLESLVGCYQDAGHDVMYVHPPRGDESNALIGSGYNTKVNALLAHCQANPGLFRAGFVDYSDHAIFTSPTNTTYFTSDGIHWNATGMAVLADSYILPKARRYFRPPAARFTGGRLGPFLPGPFLF